MPRHAAVLRLVGRLALAVACSPIACGVPRADRATVDRADYSTLPNLRRAQEELQARITREEEHVAALLERNLSLRAEEEVAYDKMLVYERDYQLRSQDLQAVIADLDRVRVEIAGARAALGEARAQLAGVQAETAQILAEAADLQRLVQSGRMALDALPAEVRALLAELPPEPVPGDATPAQTAPADTAPPEAPGAGAGSAPEGDAGGEEPGAEASGGEAEGGTEGGGEGGGEGGAEGGGEGGGEGGAGA